MEVTKAMKTAAVSELKASLSAYLAKVRAGEEVIITDRGKPVAKIVPIGKGRKEITAHLLVLERAGLARIGRGKLPEGFWDIPRPKDPKNRALKALLAEREDSR
jgi:prevent-host-death family protein